MSVDVMMENEAQPVELQELAERLRPLYEQLAEHRLYRAFTSIEDPAGVS